MGAQQSGSSDSAGRNGLMNAKALISAMQKDQDKTDDSDSDSDSSTEETDSQYIDVILRRANSFKPSDALVICCLRAATCIKKFACLQHVDDLMNYMMQVCRWKECIVPSSVLIVSFVFRPSLGTFSVQKMIASMPAHGSSAWWPEMNDTG